MASLPPARVLRAFGLPVHGARLLPGGQGTTVRVGDAVLKPAAGGGADEWAADLHDDLAALDPSGFRVPVSRRTDDSGVVVDGWVCAGALAGEHRLRPGDGAAAVAVARAFSAALAEVDRPLPAKACSCWSAADAMAWAEAGSPTWTGPAAALVDRLTGLAGPVDAPAQLVHGDLAGNLLWAQDTPPAVVDLSPYRRPAGWATALVVVDAVLWYDGAADELLGQLQDAERGQLLLRALLFRLMSSELLHRQPVEAPGPHPTEHDLQEDAHRAAPLVEHLEHALSC